MSETTNQYAILAGGIVVNTTLWDGDLEAWQPDSGQIAIVIPDGALVGVGYTYDEEGFHAPSQPGPTTEELAEAARIERDNLLVSIYDIGLTIALRALRMAKTAKDQAAANAKISELDIYAEALTAIPEQSGFPHDIQWPIQPTK